MVQNLKNLFKFILFILIFICGCPSHKNNDWNNIVVENQNEKIEKPIEKPVENHNTKLLILHNKQRELKGRTGLELHKNLIAYAQNHAEWMAKKNNLKHSDIDVLMGEWHTAGENIAWNQEDEEEVTTAWMNSSGHRANILNRNFSKVGFGVAAAKDGSLYWCTVFAD